MDASSITLVLSALGIGGIFGSVVTHWLAKRREIEFKQREQKEKRYKSTLLFMDAYLEPRNISYLNSIHPALKNDRDTKEWLKAEYRDMMLYASRETVLATKAFIDEPDEERFAQAILAMRHDLRGRHIDLSATEIRLKGSRPER